jgi:phenylacetic acid degradation operon negative regulatory protein
MVDEAASGAAGARRPLTARSVLASALLGEDPPELPVAHLVHLAGLFGVNENRARVALSRMVAAGEATTDGAGRYRLAGHLLERQDRQRASRVGTTGPWTGRWSLVVVVVPVSAADVRTVRRRQLLRARLGELREGVWVRPDNLPLELAGLADHEVVVGSADLDVDGVRLVNRLWDLDGWSARARALAEELDRLEPRDPAMLAAGFELSAEVLRHLQDDPLLPAELVPATWAGAVLRARYDRWDASYRQVLADWGRRRLR